MQCADISQRQRRLLFQCYCKTVYNTRFFNTYPTDDRVVCTRGDKENHDARMSMICENYRDYSGCSGVNVSAAAPVLGVAKAAMLAMLFAALLQ
ncbi:hypothetical protein H4R21_001235 [Coemansia helicoidea]|uniref:Uncharacterized protein n=1 Tax=Coemansia helicoidea TaxID=1286919 RepID=A0ACC1LCX9_9FUNG|nr:hypothetical protein H4R21_001235 [Coemansia helicoidea]